MVVAGPTASGKTALAIQLAQHYKTEIISADSRQFYKELPVGTAAPSVYEQNQVKHHFVENISIHEPFDVATYEIKVLKLLAQLFENHDIVILSGGSGLFIDAVCKGLDDLPESTIEIRNKVQAIYDVEGISGLQDRLKILDPEYFEKMDAQNPRRLQRALEVCMQSGNTYTSFRTGSPKERHFHIIKIAIQAERNELIDRINRRVDAMMANGLLDEVMGLLEHRHLNALNTVGYSELFNFLNGECTLEQAIEKIKINTRRYAKRQMTWFRKKDDYAWFSRDAIDLIVAFVDRHLRAEESKSPNDF